MHELSIAESILETANKSLESNPAHKIDSIRLKIGLLTAVDDDALRFALEAITDDTANCGLKIQIEKVYPRARCSSCGHVFEVRDMIYTCPQCGSFKADLEGGDELEIVSMEVS